MISLCGEKNAVDRVKWVSGTFPSPSSPGRFLFKSTGRRANHQGSRCSASLHTGQRKELVGIEDKEKEKRGKWAVLRGLRGVGGDKSDIVLLNI